MDDRVERAAEAIWRRHQSQFTYGPAVPSVALPQTWGDVSDRQKRKFREQAEDAITAASVPHERSEGEQTERPGAVDPYTKGLHAGREEMRERVARAEHALHLVYMRCARPWIDGGITYEEWDEAMAAAEAILGFDVRTKSEPEERPGKVDIQNPESALPHQAAGEDTPHG